MVLFHSENGPQITYVRDFKAKVQYFRFWCQVSNVSAQQVLKYLMIFHYKISKGIVFIRLLFYHVQLYKAL